MPEAGSGSVACSQDVASALQPCMQKDYAGDRAACMREAVGVNAPAVCASVPLRCEGLRSLTKVLQLTEAVSGCPMREGMVSIGAAIAVIFAGPIVIGAATTAAVVNAVVAASPFLTAANFPPLMPNFISAQTSTQLQLAASLSAPTGIVLVGGNGPSQGNVFAKDPQGRWGAVCGNSFTLVNAHVVCQQLGYSQGPSRKMGSCLWQLLYSSQCSCGLPAAGLQPSSQGLRSWHCCGWSRLALWGPAIWLYLF